MRKTIRPIFHLLLATHAVFACSAGDGGDGTPGPDANELTKSPEVTEETRSLVPCESLTIDGFDSGIGKMYRPFGRETTLSQSGYGIYYVEATVNVSLATSADQSTRLRVEYTLPPHFSWGNWASVRKEFGTITDASACDGIEIEIEVERSSGADLRLTLADVATPGDVDRHGADEMWWFDISNRLLGSTGQAFTVKAPFSSFRLGYGDGARTNNHQLDLSHLVGYEINMVSSSGNTESGSFFVNAIRGFKG